MKTRRGPVRLPAVGSGLSRTGTRSVYAALIRHGISAVHYPFDRSTQLSLERRELPKVAEQAVILDLSSAAFFEDLVRAKPGTPVIHTTRPVQSWLPAVAAHYDGLLAQWDDYPSRFQDFSSWITEQTYGAFPPQESDFLRTFRQQEERVDAWAARNPGDVLTVNVFTGEGYGDLGPFLGLEKFSGESFPHIRDSDELPVSGNMAERTILLDEM